jgi:hypothetical protein
MKRDAFAEGARVFCDDLLENLRSTTDDHSLPGI